MSSFQGEVVGLKAVRKTEDFGLLAIGSLVTGMVCVESYRRGFSKSGHFWRCRCKTWFLRGFG